MDKNLFESFFDAYSKNVDNADFQGFWKLTDKILETFLLENIFDRNEITLVDLGGGTGRWLYKLDKYFKDSRFILVDLSGSMLHQAKIKIDKGLFKNKVEIIKCNIAHIDKIKSGSVNYVISTYNPLSFCNNPQKVINESYRILKPKGRAMITVQGYYNALYSKVNNFLATAEEINQIFKDKKVQWNSSVPKLWQLSKEDMEYMFKKSGFKDVNSRGIACVVQPQENDFDPENKKSSAISKKLLNKDYFDSLFKIEVEIGSNQNTVNRGMNILTIGHK